MVNEFNIEDILFDFKMVNCQRRNSVYSTVPYVLEKSVFNSIKKCAGTLDRLCRKILNDLNTTYSDYKNYIKNFTYRDEILDLEVSTSEIFWTRYDAFLKESGGFFFSEFNYDKPCGQREIMFTGSLHLKNNINSSFEKIFIDSFKKAITKNNKKNHYNIAILVDPCHYEETHLAMLYKSKLQSEKFSFILAGPKNLKVKENEVYAFNTKIDVILRQFPTEYSSEINDFSKILNLFDEGKILIINDPRIIAIQCKTMFAYFWKLLNNDDQRLTLEEKKVIRASIPYTELLNDDNINLAINDKNTWVIKPIYGRYSENVFIGTTYSNSEWIEVIKYVEDKKEDYILQKFCTIQEDFSVLQDKNIFTPSQAFANFGIYLSNGKFAGICPRWNEGYLTCEEGTWITPICFNESQLNITKTGLKEDKRLKLWKKINNEALFEHAFNGIYNKGEEYVSLDAVILSKDKFNELKRASIDMSKLFYKTTKLVQDNFDMLGDALGIHSLKSLACQNFTNSFVSLGRMDWVIDDFNNLKLIEINSETPAGIVESIWINNRIHERLYKKYQNPNTELALKFKSNVQKIINDYEKRLNIKNIAILSSTYYEDWYTAKAIKDIISDLPYNIVQGNIYDVEVENSSIYLYGERIDAVYRYYPLDWFEKEDEGLKEVLKALEKNTLSINPPHTIISQSKAFLALLWELKRQNQNFFSEEENTLIEKYIPKTTLDVDNLSTIDFCMKPILDREGSGVKFACNINEAPEFECIFQERVNIKAVQHDIYSVYGKKNTVTYPILGVYITDTEFAGIYTRLGSLITNNCCVYAPTYIEQEGRK